MEFIYFIIEWKKLYNEYLADLSSFIFCFLSSVNILAYILFQSPIKKNMYSMSKFILILVLEIPAIILSLIILTYFALNRQIRLKLKNHGWLILLISNFFQLIVDLPMPMSYYRMESVWPASNSYCV